MLISFQFVNDMWDVIIEEMMKDKMDEHLRTLKGIADFEMEYLYCKNDNFEDFASGRVFYGGKGIPNFPVRLLNEIYGRAKSYLEKRKDIVIYDPCCGGGYTLTVLGFFHNRDIKKMYGSDIDGNMVMQAKRNTVLLTNAGLKSRRDEIERLYNEYRKSSHMDALDSCDTLKDMLEREILVEIFRADCTRPLPQIMPDIIITDVPYGKLVEWDNEEQISIDCMLEQLWMISHDKTILAVCMDKKQKINCEKWKRLEKHNIGKRKFEILKKIDKI